MSDARTQFVKTCQQWGDLTLTEARPIQASNWTAVEQCQLAKAELQDRLLQAIDQLRRVADPEQAAQVEPDIQTTVGHLLSLERQNEAALAARYEQARQQQAHLAQASHNLRQLRRTYGVARPSGWQGWS